MLRDLVGGAACDPQQSSTANPLSRFVDTAAQARQQLDLAREFGASNNYAAAAIDAPPHVDSFVDSFLHSRQIAGPMGDQFVPRAMGDIWAEEMASRFAQDDVVVRDETLHSFFRSLLVANTQAQILNVNTTMGLPPLSHVDKMKVASRVAILCKHAAPEYNEEFLAAQSQMMDSVLQSVETLPDTDGWASQFMQDRRNRDPNEFNVHMLQRPLMRPQLMQQQLWPSNLIQMQPNQQQQQQQNEEQQQEQNEEQEQQQENSAAKIIQETMEHEEDSRFQHSKFLDFVRQINRGTVQLDGGQPDTDVSALNEAWSQALREWETSFPDPYLGEETQQETAREMKEYSFLESNPFMDQANPFDMGVDLLSKGKTLDAIKCFEAEVTRHPENSDAWLSLGLAHAENDEDVRAIIALSKAVAANPENLDALLALGVSHTNELERVPAMHHLKSWLQKHPDYSSIAQLSTEGDTLHQQVIRLFEQAAQLKPTDAELFTVLGVLHNMSHEFDRAVDAFRTALMFNPNDYTLWNKLGATLANSYRSEEAIDAYLQALRLKPDYVRALANLAISYSNLSQHNEGSACYLRALSLNPNATHLWNSLRICFACLGRDDLLEKCSWMDVNAFKGEIEF